MKSEYEKEEVTKCAACRLGIRSHCYCDELIFAWTAGVFSERYKEGGDTMKRKLIESGLYVAADGSYGDAAGMSIIDDRDWTDEEFEMLAQWGDFRRADFADALDTWIKEGRPDLEENEDNDLAFTIYNHYR